MILKNIELVVFDMAGTTIDENNIVYKTLQRSLLFYGYNIPLDTVLSLGAGKEKHTAIKDLLAQKITKNEIENISSKVFSHFKKELKLAYKTLVVSAINGVETLFASLHKNEIKIVLNTGYDYPTAKSLIDKLGWHIGKEIDALITADDVTTGRPSPEMIYKAMEMFSITDASKVLKAGDSVVDIEEGKNANCGVTVAVLSGAQTEEQLEKANPTLILENLGELKSML